MAVFIDTFGQATAGFDENSSSDMGKASQRPVHRSSNRWAHDSCSPPGKTWKGARGHSRFMPLWMQPLKLT